MCGIAGFELASDLDEHVMRRLVAELANRGPDGDWFVTRGRYALVQTRLAVIDLSANVAYPMANEAEDVWLLFNGEVYDHVTLRRELERSGHQFRTRCDAEVVLHGYEEYGLEFLGRIDGMFALALWDERRAELILARDQLGVKPLVYTTSGRFAFASEALALVSAGLCDGEPNSEAIEEFAAFHYVPMPHTGIVGLEHVEPGCAVLRDGEGRTRAQRWIRRPFTAGSTQERFSQENLVGQTAQALDESVRRQLVADVPVGVFLSSGIDSSLVLDSAVRNGARPVAFTVGFRDHRDFDETAAAHRFASHVGVRHVCRDLRLEFHEALASVEAAYDQPFADASALATLAVARMAKEEVTVALSGTGGDDLFAGYYRHRAHKLLPVARRVSSLLQRVGGDHTTDEPRSAIGLARSYFARLGAASDGDAFNQYLALLGRPGGEELPTRKPSDARETRAKVASRLDAQTGEQASILAAIQTFEMQTYLPSDLLTKEDRATMAVGLEGRVPMLGRELVRFAESLEYRQLLSWRTGKRPLRALARRRLPRFVTIRRKRGFAVPLGALFAGPWRQPAAEWLRDANSSHLQPARVADALLAGDMHATTVWAACVLISWEARLADARRKGAELVAR